ncbi:hypothetical protein A0H81_03923 [Grifola frondosa]|uniref:CxC2-like cysteine cluster KDZ transposase-associated domain-containing protein n=1 Tax=Grifola frondosa TaxID=5627 RepID=A0A1C7MHK7_GRIFR|nr:hypothetical protein A0H81_03923 [Grifola frondosa]
MWRHLKLLKRAGRGHDPAGISAIAEGSCAVLCPSCPHPGKNLPDDWASAPPSRKWLYTLFVGLDANFRLKRKKVSSKQKDPGLNHGYAYFVEDNKYQKFIEDFGTLQFEEASTCNNHDALKLAHMKGSNGTAASGVGTVECTRHDMKRPCSVGDLQKGERYVNMDYLFFSSMVHHSTDSTVISYDIACQWSRHIWERLLQYDHFFDWEHGCITFLIPKFHLPAHQSSCQTSFSFNLTLNVGHTDGEAVERGWAAVNPFASSTKEMGPGARRDLLDDVFGDYNWRKICQLPELFLTKIKDAIEERNEQMLAFQEFNAALPTEDTARWKKAIEYWETDIRKPNPFVATRPSITLASARLRLAEEERKPWRWGQA